MNDEADPTTRLHAWMGFLLIAGAVILGTSIAPNAFTIFTCLTFLPILLGLTVVFSLHATNAERSRAGFHAFMASVAAAATVSVGMTVWLVPQIVPDEADPQGWGLLLAGPVYLIGACFATAVVAFSTYMILRARAVTSSTEVSSESETSER